MARSNETVVQEPVGLGVDLIWILRMWGLCKKNNATRSILMVKRHWMRMISGTMIQEMENWKMSNDVSI